MSSLFYEIILERARAIGENIVFTFLSSESLIVLRWSDKNAYRTFSSPVIRLLLVKDVPRHFKEKHIRYGSVKSIGFSFLKIFNKIAVALSSQTRGGQGEGVRVSDVTSFGDDWDRSWVKIREDYDFILEKNSEYLNWRYCDERAGCKVKCAYDGDEVLGFIALEVRGSGGYQDGYITDLLVPIDRPDVAEALVADAFVYFDGLGVNAVHSVVVKGDPLHKLLGRVGFLAASEVYRV